MKKILIGLGVFTIAFSTFVTPILAQLANDSDMYEAFLYREWIKSKKNRDLSYFTYSTSTFETLGLNTCKYKNFNKALEILKNTDYNSYVSLVISHNTPERATTFINLMKQYTSTTVCPEVKNIKF